MAVGRSASALLILAATLRPEGARAAEPSNLQLGPLTLGIDASASIAPEDPAYFNFTGTYGNPLRMGLIGLTGSLRLTGPLAVLAEVRTENAEPPRVYALYLRLRPWAERSFHIQAGRIPPVFGSFARRPYLSGNALVGQPLGYQYLVALRRDAVPFSADDLLAMRGEGWLVRYPRQVGPPEPAPGLPLVQGLLWDTGVEARLGSDPLQLAVAVTQGTLCSPRFRDDNDDKQVSARLGWQPSAGFVMGVSAARGEHLDEALTSALPPRQASRSLAQRALGLDVEYSQGHWIARAEAIWSEWDLPRLGEPRIDDPVGALSLSAEGQVKLAAGFYLAARLDHLSFTQISGSGGRQGWEAPVARAEGVVGYSPWRGLTLKAGYQHNWRDAGLPGRRGFPMAQVTWGY